MSAKYKLGDKVKVWINYYKPNDKPIIWDIIYEVVSTIHTHRESVYGKRYKIEDIYTYKVKTWKPIPRWSNERFEMKEAGLVPAEVYDVL